VKKVFSYKKVIKLFCLVYIFLFVFCFFNKPIVANAKPNFIKTKNEYALISKFSTSIKNSSKDRIHNIKLACEKINGTVIDIKSVFSFNKVVGERTKKAGYKSAKIIENGEFVEGIGGGVCQVSTTLYNAILLAGLTVLEYHPHSLKVGYVPASLDAMVSYPYADLKFFNQTNLPIYVKMQIDAYEITAKIYGEKTNATYKTESVIVNRLPPNEPDIIEEEIYQGEESEEFITYPIFGTESESYLIKYLGDKVIEKTRIRKDKYKSVKGVILRKKLVENLPQIKENG